LRDELGKIRERTGEAIDFLDHYHIDQSTLDVLEQALQGRAIQIAAREGRSSYCLGRQSNLRKPVLVLLPEDDVPIWAGQRPPGSHAPFQRAPNAGADLGVIVAGALRKPLLDGYDEPEILRSSIRSSTAASAP
jgi:hypothetical protein